MDTNNSETPILGKKAKTENKNTISEAPAPSETVLSAAAPAPTATTAAPKEGGRSVGLIVTLIIVGAAALAAVVVMTIMLITHFIPSSSSDSGKSDPGSSKTEDKKDDKKDDKDKKDDDTKYDDILKYLQGDSDDINYDDLMKLFNDSGSDDDDLDSLDDILKYFQDSDDYDLDDDDLDALKKLLSDLDLDDDDDDDDDDDKPTQTSSSKELKLGMLGKTISFTGDFVKDARSLAASGLKLGYYDKSYNDVAFKDIDTFLNTEVKTAAQLYVIDDNDDSVIALKGTRKGNEEFNKIKDMEFYEIYYSSSLPLTLPNGKKIQCHSTTYNDVISALGKPTNENADKEWADYDIDGWNYTIYFDDNGKVSFANFEIDY